MSKSSDANGVSAHEKEMPRKQPSVARDLLYLVSCAVNDEPVSAERCADMDLERVYCLAQYHSLSAAAAFALEQVTELPRVFDQAKKKAIRKMALFEIERGKILREFERQGIRYLPLKGILVKEYYPKAAMREMSDNDILCEADKMSSVKEVMTALGYTCDSYDVISHDIYSKPPSLDFEMHRTLFEDDRQPFYDYYLNIWDKLICDGGCAMRMTDEDFYLYLVAHIYRHYAFAGIGLRSLADIYLFLKKRGGDLRREYLDAELEKLGLKAFEHGFSALAQKVFTGQPLQEKEKAELTYIITSGSYGTSDNKDYHLVSEKLEGDDSKQAKRRFYFRKVFISGYELKKRYPFVYKHKALYPLLLAYRPIKGLFTHPRWLLNEYRNIKAFRKDAENAFHFENNDTKINDT